MNCTCQAYKFPHRPEGGRCYAASTGPFCGSCGEPCSPKEIDEGIGSYEFWGHKGVDRRIVTVSHCCEASVYEDASLKVNYHD